jgi:hypothetical protein
MKLSCCVLVTCHRFAKARKALPYTKHRSPLFHRVFRVSRLWPNAKTLKVSVDCLSTRIGRMMSARVVRSTRSKTFRVWRLPGGCPHHARPMTHRPAPTGWVGSKQGGLTLHNAERGNASIPQNLTPRVRRLTNRGGAPLHVERGSRAVIVQPRIIGVR